MNAFFDHPGSALIAFLLVAGGTWLLGYLFAGGFERKWDRTIQLVASKSQTPWQAVEGPYLPGAISIASRHSIEGLRLPFTRSGTMPTIEGIYWHHIKPDMTRTIIGVVHMNDRRGYIECKFAPAILLHDEPGSTLEIVIRDPNTWQQFVYSVQWVPSAFSDVS